MKRPRFSLRTLFVLVALAAIPMGWVAYQLNWIRQRHQELEELDLNHNVTDISVSAPWSIRIFCEPGVPIILVDPDVAGDLQAVDRLKRLFPEAKICTPIDGRPVHRNPNPGFATKEI